MGTESLWLKGPVETPVQLLKRLEAHDWDHKKCGDTRRWMAGNTDRAEILLGAKSVPNGKEIMKYYRIAWNLANYGHR